jgi:filamentous hemagglutinin family protein
VGLNLRRLDAYRQHLDQSALSHKFQGWFMVDGVRAAGGRSKLHFGNGRIKRAHLAALELRLNPTALMVAAAFGALTSLAHANPQGAKVVNGQATITSHGNTLVIKNTPGAIINWQSFSIGAGQITDFVQQSVNSAILNRVVGVDPSVILGTLESNGHVFLVNPNGVVFGKGATVDAAGLVVSSLNITDQDFKNGTLRFVGSDAAGDISVAGVLHSSDGDVYLIAPNVTNTGSITATNGAVVLAAGQDVEILGSGLTDIQFNVQNKGNTAINLGQINGDAVGIFAGTLTQAGGVNATTATVTGGKVVLSALGDVSLASGSSTAADNAAGSGGSIAIQSVGGNISVASGASISASGASGGAITLLANGGSDSVTGSVAASGTLGLGGTVDILGQSVTLGSTAAVDASGNTGGGQLVVGGLAKSATLLQSSATSVAAGAILSADATGSGDGGHVVVFGLNTMDMYGSISARGGIAGGNGGLIETSGEVISIGGGVIAANARAVDGKAGTWLLDPGAINITTGGSAYSAGGTASSIDPASIATVLDNGTNVVVSTSNVSPLTPGAGEADSITVSSAIVATAVKDGASLSLSAGGDIFVNAAITAIAAPGFAGATLNMNANTEGSGGNISVAAPIYIPGGNINASGAGFTNTNTITALNITASIDAGGGTTGTGFQNSGVIDASGASNLSFSGGSVYVASSEAGVTSNISGTINANANLDGEGGAGGTISILNAGDIKVSGATLSAVGAAGAPGSGIQGGPGGTINLSSAGALNISGASSISVIGGDGAYNATATSGQGGAGGTLYLTGASVNVTGLIVDAYGGAGGSITNPTGYTLAGAGGLGGTIDVSGASGAVTLMDTSMDASGGSSQGGGGNGGTGGAINISALGAISITGGSYTVSGGAGGAGLSSATTFGLSDGGYGGDGGTITISGQSVALGMAGDGTNLLANGGAGGAGAIGSDANGTANAFNGTNGGAGGSGGSISILTSTNNDGSGTISLASVIADVNGGNGGIGGAYAGNTATLQNTAGYGGAGGNAGLISVSGFGAITLTNSSLNGVAGNGGDGGSLTGIDPVAIAGSGGNGGAGGVISVISLAGTGNSEADISLVSSTISIIGGNGGNGGVAENSLGGGGSGGNGGNSTTNLNASSTQIGLGINISGIGVITIDGNSSLSSIGGNGGNGASAQGLNATGYNIVGPGNGGNGGTAGSIQVESTFNPGEANTVTLSNAGLITIVGGNGGNGGGLLSGAIQNNGGTLSGGTGGTGGDAGAYQGDSGALNMYADNGSLVNTGIINSLGGSGGNGGLSNDQYFGPGNGGNGGNAAYIYTEGGNGDNNFGGTVNMGGGNGGNGGNVTVTSNNIGGNSGNGGNTDYFEIDSYGPGSSILTANINYNVGFEGIAGSDTVGNHVGNYGNFGNAGIVYLYSQNGSITQNDGNITGVSGAIHINASALNGSVSLGSTSNGINSVTGYAGNGGFSVYSDQGLYQDYGSITATGDVNLAAPYLYVYDNINSQGSLNLTATNGELYINTSIAGSSSVNLTANGLLTLDAFAIVQAGSPGNIGNVSLDAGQINVSAGAQLLALNGSGTLTVTGYNDTGTIYLSGDNYATIGSTGMSQLVLGSEFFNAINFSAISIGDNNTPSITAQSFSGNPGTITIAAGDSLALTAGTIGNDSLTSIKTDQLSVVANTANLSGLTTTNGGPLLLAGSGLAYSGSTLSVTMAPGGSILVGDVNSQFDGNTIYGIEYFNSVTLLGSSVHLEDSIYNTGSNSSVTLGSNNPASVLAIGGTGYAWDLSATDLNYIYSNNITIGAPGQTGAIVVAGPVTVNSSDNNVTAVNLSTTGGGISLAAGNFNVGSAALTLTDSGSGSITDAGTVSITGASISLNAGGAIGSTSAPIVISTPGVFGATAQGGGIYINSQGSLFTESQGISATGDVVISATSMFNYGNIYGNNVSIYGGSNFGSSGLIQSNDLLNITAGDIQTFPGSITIAGGVVNLTGISTLGLQGTVGSGGVLNLTGGDIMLSSYVGYQTLISGTDITISGSSLYVVGATGSSIPMAEGLRSVGRVTGAPTTGSYSTAVEASGTLNVTISGDMTVDGGNTTGGSAALVSAGDSVYNIGGNLNMSGGTASGAFALLDPTNGGTPATPGTTMTITANQVNLTGGSVPNAYAAIVATGNVVFNAAQQVTLTQGTEPNADAVVISKTGTITANTPDCVNCTPHTGSNPLLNTDTNQGFYGGVAAAPPPAPAPAPPPPPAPAPAPVASGGQNGLGDPANDTLIQDLITLLDIPLDAQNNPPPAGLIFVDGGVDGCF